MEDAPPKSCPSWEEIARASQLTHLAALGSLEEMRRSFRGPQSRHRFIERLTFPEGFVCRRCSNRRDPSRPMPGILTCSACGDVHELRARTIFEDESVPLSRWFDLFWCIASGQPVLDVRSVSRVLELAEVREAARCLEGVRAVLVHAERALLSGVVEVDARVVDLGAVHVIVMCAAERRAQGRVTLRHAHNLAAETVQSFVNAVVEPGSTVRTDCWSGYLDRAPTPYRHEVDEEASHGGIARLAAVDTAVTVLRSWLHTRDALIADELGLYLDEFCVRFNRASHARTGEVFCQLLGVALDPHAARRVRRKRREQSGVRCVPSFALMSQRLRRSGTS